MKKLTPNVMVVSYEKAISTDWEAEVLALEEKGCQAFLAADIPTLDRLWAADFVVNSPLNRIHDKALVLQLLAAGRIRHQSMESVVERMVRTGDVVIVMGNDSVTDPPDGGITRRRFTNVWERQHGEWRTIARHAQIVPPADA